METALPDALELARALPKLRLLALHGSRARGDAHALSDWDFAYLADDGFDELDLRSRLARILGTDAVDVADLARAGGLLRYRVARAGRPLFEREPGEFEGFALRAITFWLDVEVVLRPAYGAVLENLG
jgi:predicted nucleotidyltransferase